MVWVLFIGILVFFIGYDIKMEYKLKQHRINEMRLKDIIEELEQKLHFLEAKRKRGKTKEQ